MKLIANADRNWGIGRDGGLLFSIPEDMKRFRNMTIGNAVVMGRKTLESFPGGKPLPDRENIVLTTNPQYDVMGAKACNSVKELLSYVKTLPCDVFVIGGGEIYKMLLPLCDRAYITRVDENGAADTFMPPLKGGWSIASRSEIKEFNGIKYVYEEYKRDRICPSCLFQNR